MWDTASEQELSTLKGHTGSVYTIAMLPYGWLVSGSDDGAIKEWDLKERKEVGTLERYTDSIVPLKVPSNGNLVS